MNVGFSEEKMGNIPHPSRHAIIINLRSGNKTNPRLQSHVIITFQSGKCDFYKRRSKDRSCFK